MSNWMEADDCVVVATIAFGMGIDRADVRFIFHFDAPISLESWCTKGFADVSRVFLIAICLYARVGTRVLLD
jgi:hypothetical protein